MSISGLADAGTVATGTASNSSPPESLSSQDTVENDLYEYLTNHTIPPKFEQLPSELYSRYETYCKSKNVLPNILYSLSIRRFINNRNKQIHSSNYDQYKSGMDYNNLSNLINSSPTITNEIINNLSDELITNLIFNYTSIQNICNKIKYNDIKQFINTFIKTGIIPDVNLPLIEYKLILQSIQPKHYSHFFVCKLLDHLKINIEDLQSEYITDIQLQNSQQDGIDILINYIENKLSKHVGDKRKRDDLSSISNSSQQSNKPPDQKKLKFSDQVLSESPMSKISQITNNAIRSAESLLIDDNNNNSNAMRRISSTDQQIMDMVIPDSQSTEDINDNNNNNKVNKTIPLITYPQSPRLLNNTNSNTEETDNDLYLSPADQATKEIEMIKKGIKLNVGVVTEGDWNDITPYAEQIDFLNIDKENKELDDDDDEEEDYELVKFKDLKKDPRWTGHERYCDETCEYHKNFTIYEMNHNYNNNNNHYDNISDIEITNNNNNNNNSKFLGSGNGFIDSIQDILSMRDNNNINTISQFRNDNIINMPVILTTEPIPEDMNYIQEAKMGFDVNGGTNKNLYINNYNSLIHHEADPKLGMDRCHLMDPIERNRLSKKLFDQTLLGYNDLKIMSTYTCPQRTDDINLQREDVYDACTQQILHNNNLHEYPNINLVINVAKRHQIKFEECPTIEFEIDGNIENVSALAYGKFQVICNAIGGTWAEFGVGDILTHRILKPNDEHRRDILQKQRKSYLQQANNINNINNNQNVNSFKKIRYDEALKKSDKIMYTINNQFSDEYKEENKDDIGQEYYITNGIVNFYEKPNLFKRIVFYININGPLYQKYKESLVNELIDDLTTNQSKLNDIKSFDSFCSKKANTNIMINNPQNDIQIQMRLPQNQFNDEGDQFRLYENITSIFRIYNESLDIRNQQINNHNKLKPINVNIKNIYRHKQNNYQKRKEDFERRQKQSPPDFKLSKKSLFRDKVTITLSNCNYNDIPDMIDMGGSSIKIEKIGIELDEVDIAIRKYCHQCPTCLGYTCPKNECVYYQAEDEKRRQYQERSRDPRIKNMKRMGRGCYNCGEIGGHWLSRDWKCPNHKYCKHCGSSDHSSKVNCRCPVASGIAIRCEMYNEAFVMNTREFKNNNNNKSFNIDDICNKWKPKHILVTPSMYNVFTWKTKQTQCDQIYEQSIRNWKLHQINCRKISHYHKSNYISKTIQDVDNNENDYNPKQYIRNNEQILFERIRYEQLQYEKKNKDKRRKKLANNEYLKQRIIDMGKKKRYNINKINDSSSESDFETKFNNNTNNEQYNNPKNKQFIRILNNDNNNSNNDIHITTNKNIDNNIDIDDINSTTLYTKKQKRQRGRKNKDKTNTQTNQLTDSNNQSSNLDKMTSNLNNSNNSNNQSLNNDNQLTTPNNQSPNNTNQSTNNDNQSSNNNNNKLTNSNNNNKSAKSKNNSNQSSNISNRLSNLNTTKPIFSSKFSIQQQNKSKTTKSKSKTLKAIKQSGPQKIRQIVKEKDKQIQQQQSSSFILSPHHFQDPNNIPNIHVNLNPHSRVMSHENGNDTMTIENIVSKKKQQEVESTGLDLLPPNTSGQPPGNNNNNIGNMPNRNNNFQSSHNVNRTPMVDTTGKTITGFVNPNTMKRISKDIDIDMNNE